MSAILDNIKLNRKTEFFSNSYKSGKSIKEENSKLIDNYQRHIHKLRVQLTDVCNFRCFYCMPENIKFMPNNELLTSTEIYNICKILNQFGIDEIRLTGGEPTLRKDFEKIISKLATLNLKKLGLTSNGYLLSKKLPFLKEFNCLNLNISLDSLNMERFNNITKTNKYFQVLDTILKAKEFGFNVKVNTVIMKGVNDHEIFDFIKFSRKYDIEVRFLELMKIGMAYKNNPEYFIPAKDVLNIIKEKEKLYKVKKEIDSTSFNYLTETGAKIGFIASESMSFCNHCSRLRLSAKGKLRACLMSEQGINLKNIQKEDYHLILQNVLAMKPIERIPHIEQTMNQIGG